MYSNKQLIALLEIVDRQKVSIKRFQDDMSGKGAAWPLSILAFAADQS